jgi:type VI protein secretion system component Hcp
VTRMFAAIVIVLSLASAAAAQGPPGLEKKEAPEHSSISIKVEGLGCNMSLGNGTFSAITYAFGATNPSSIGTATGTGGGAGKATVMPLSVTKLFDECSPALFGAVLTGDHISAVDLTQEDSKGHVILTINLKDAQITSYQIGGSQASDSPHESIQIDFAKICISDTSNGNKFCFDRTANTKI